MARGSMVRRHAQAIFELARDAGELEGWESDLNTVVAALGEPEIVAMLQNPRLPFEEKAELARTCLPGMRQLVLNLVYLLLLKGRLGILRDIVEEYGRMLDAHRGIEHAEVTTAIVLDEAQVGGVSRRLAELVGREVRISVRVDPQIIGGLVVRIGDTLIDGSTRSRLNGLRRELVEAAT